MLRPFNTFGPRQSARAIIPTIITQIVNGKTSIRLGSTHPTRDFSFISDTVSGFEAALRSENAVGQVINLGSNFEISIGHTAHMIAEVLNTEIEIVVEESRLRPTKSEVERLWADNSKAKEMLDWQPNYGGTDGFRQALTETASWFQEPENIQSYKSDIYNL